MKNLDISVIAITLFAASTVPAFADPPAGRLLASQCFQCHGTNGQSKSDFIDGISGLSASHLLNELTDMKTTDDTLSVMIQQARVYTDAELQLIANFLGAQASGSSSGSSSPSTSQPLPWKTTP